MKFENIVVELAQNESVTQRALEALVENPTALLTFAIFTVLALGFGLCAGLKYFFKPYDKENPNEPTIF